MTTVIMIVSAPRVTPAPTSRGDPWFEPLRVSRSVERRVAEGWELAGGHGAFDHYGRNGLPGLQVVAFVVTA